MNERVEELALDNLALRPKKIRVMISREMSERSKTWKGITYTQVRKHMEYVKT